jgi:hypothetical protein
MAAQGSRGIHANPAAPCLVICHCLREVCLRDVCSRRSRGNYGCWRGDGLAAPRRHRHDPVFPSSTSDEPSSVLLMVGHNWESRVVNGGDDGTRPCPAPSAVSTSSGRTAGA